MHIIPPNNNQPSPGSKDPGFRGEEKPLAGNPEMATQQRSTCTLANDDEFNRRVELIRSIPIIRNIQDQEIGKMVLGLSVPITTAFTIYFFYQKSTPIMVNFVVVLLSIGCTAILNGLLLRDCYPFTATFMEILGIEIVLLAIHGMAGSFLPPEIRWILGLIAVSTAAPLIISAISLSLLIISYYKE